MAQTPTPSDELVQQTRESLLVIYSAWKPIKTPQERANLITEIVRHFSIYPFGALPSDPVQAKAKIDEYASVLEQCPLWAIVKAKEEWREVNHEPMTASVWLNKTRKHMGYYAGFGKPNGFGVYELTTGRAYQLMVEWVKKAKRDE